MVGEAGVGDNRAREGVDPLIIFNREDVLGDKKVSEVKKLTQDIATKKYQQWYNVANTNRKYPW